MITVLMIFQAFVSVLLIISVLLQFGKGAEAGLISGGASESVFTGGQQGNILTKVTIVLSVLFIGNSLFLAKLQSNSSAKTIFKDEAPVARPLNNDAAEAKAIEEQKKLEAEGKKDAKDAKATEAAAPKAQAKPTAEPKK